MDQASDAWGRGVEEVINVCSRTHYEARENIGRFFADLSESILEMGEVQQGILDIMGGLRTLVQAFLGFVISLLGSILQGFERARRFYAVFSQEDVVRLKGVVSSMITPIITSPVYSWLVAIFRLCFIPVVAYSMEDRPEQIFLLIYSFIMLKRDDLVKKQDEGAMRLWRLLLPSLLLARHALPTLPMDEPSLSSEAQGRKRPWRILSITLHLVVILLEIREVTSDSTDPALESLVVGAMSIYVMSLSVWTGISVLGLLLMAFLFNLYVYPVSKLEPQFIYAGAFYLERALLAYDIADETQEKTIPREKKNKARRREVSLQHNM